MERQHVAAAAVPPPSAPAPARSASAKPGTAPAPAPPTIPDSQATVATPIDGISPTWTTRNQQNELRLLLDGHANVLFLGDSITDGFANGAGKAVWDTFLAPLNADDFAIGGFTTSQVLWQIEAGQVAAVSPDVVVLMIGTNNLGLGQSPAAAVAGITRIVDEIHAQLPKSEILLLGVLPRGESPTDPFRAKIEQVNSKLAELEGNGVTFLDIGAWFLQPDGTISPTVMPDFLHPSEWGYELYTAAIWDTLMQLLRR